MVAQAVQQSSGGGWGPAVLCQKLLKIAYGFSTVFPSEPLSEEKAVVLESTGQEVAEFFSHEAGSEFAVALYQPKAISVYRGYRLPCTTDGLKQALEGAANELHKCCDDFKHSWRQYWMTAKQKDEVLDKFKEGQTLINSSLQLLTQSPSGVFLAELQAVAKKIDTLIESIHMPAEAKWADTLSQGLLGLAFASSSIWTYLVSAAIVSVSAFAMLAIPFASNMTLLSIQALLTLYKYRAQQLATDKKSVKEDIFEPLAKAFKEKIEMGADTQVVSEQINLSYLATQNSLDKAKSAMTASLEEIKSTQQLEGKELANKVAALEKQVEAQDKKLDLMLTLLQQLQPQSQDTSKLAPTHNA